MKQNIMKKVLLKGLPCLLIVLSLFTLASCKSCRKDKYPTKIPAITNPDGTFLTIDKYNVTNKNIYYRLLQSYGQTMLTSQIDQIILKDYAYDQKEFEKQMNKIIYDTEDLTELTDEEKAELYEDFEIGMAAQGYTTKEAWEAYYLLEFKRMNYGIEAFKKFVKEYDEDEDNEEPYFTEKKYEDYYKANYHKDLNLILITFDSEAQAKAIMKTCGINIDHLNGDWEDLNGTKLTQKQIKEAFQNMYEYVYGKTIEDGVTYTYKDLTKISSAIATRVYKLETYDPNNEDSKLSKSYTHGPLVYGSRFFLALQTGAGEIETLEEAKTDVFEGMVKNSVSNAYVARIMNEARNKISLKIYDEGLEKIYVANYKSVYSSLSITDYEDFKTTTEESDKNIATFTINGKDYTITADDMFNYLTDQYGVTISLLLFQQYIVLGNPKYNGVYDYVNNKVLNQEKFDEYFKTDITDYKKSFEKGDFAASGYPKTYGWNNFLRDYLGITEELQLLINLDSTLYEDSLAILKKAMYMTEADKVEEGKTTDQAIQDEMERIFNDFFSATVVGATAYYDDDFDGIADELEADSQKAKDAAALVNAIYAAAKTVDKKTLTERLSRVVLQYNLATQKDATWGSYKIKGLRVNMISATTYSNTKTADKALLEAIRGMWKEIVAYANLENEEGKVIGTTITGQSLDPGYRYIKNSVVYYVTAEQFSDKVDAVITENGAYRVAITNATGNTYISSSDKLYKPTLAEYENYLLPEKDENKKPVSSALSTAIKTYYIAAINNLASDEKVNDLMMERCLELLSKVTFTKNNEANKALAERLIKANMSDKDAE